MIEDATLTQLCVAPIDPTKISILKEALSYHKIFKDNISLLLPTVRKFYQL